MLELSPFLLCLHFLSPLAGGSRRFYFFFFFSLIAILVRPRMPTLSYPRFVCPARFFFSIFSLNPGDRASCCHIRPPYSLPTSRRQDENLLLLCEITRHGLCFQRGRLSFVVFSLFTVRPPLPHPSSSLPQPWTLRTFFCPPLSKGNPCFSLPGGCQAMPLKGRAGNRLTPTTHSQRQQAPVLFSKHQLPLFSFAPIAASSVPGSRQVS